VEKAGEALTLSVFEDKDMVNKIERVLGEPIQRRRLDGFDYANLVSADRFQTPDRIQSRRRQGTTRPGANGRGRKRSRNHRKRNR
jgi:hypothetical protein